ncbi:MAG: transglutaminase family protein [Pigmentiphaga sp.]|nr:transglutaminase family protein [Pigmentiphaga sp.]
MTPITPVFTPYGWPEPGPEYLESTRFFDYEQTDVRDFVHEAVGDASAPREQMVRLFLAVRDAIRYDPYSARITPECFRASTVVGERAAFCIPKASLLVAGARLLGVPAALGLSDVVNHFSTPKMQQIMGGREVFMHHGWAALYIDGRWVKAAPAFNRELCDLMRVPPTDFDGEHDAILQQYASDGSEYMDYLKDHGIWSDVPFLRIASDWAGYYPATLWNERQARIEVDDL